MEFKEINVLEGIVQQIDHEGSVAGITVELGNVDHIYSNFNLDVSYEDTLEDIEEINMERARYLLSTDEMSEEMLGETQG
ncbi:MAG: hypothetical protein EPN24_01935 [Candidatus Methanoperedens sp.]|nr:MAG: hypothetical protein EPN24_01935 [Candidatus Methanoperedens sp.]